MYDSIGNYLHLTEAEMAFLRAVEQQMPILADLSRADVLLYGRQSEDKAVVLAHAEPRSIAHVYSKNQAGRAVNMSEKPEIERVLVHGKRQKEKRGYISEGAPVVKQALPIYFPPPVCAAPLDEIVPDPPRVIAGLVIVTNLLEYERNRLRSEVFRKAIKKLQTMVWYGQLSGAVNLSSFGEQDGILFVDATGVIRYVSGVANNLYRKLGYKDALVGRPLSLLETEDEKLYKLALSQNQCLEQSSEEADRFWTRKVLPLTGYPAPLWRRFFPQKLGRQQWHGVLITLHDDTESRSREQELKIKNAMIQEVHHRVKNNLQTIAGLVRMQARRTTSAEARQVLDETLHRILSIAVIHEYLSNESPDIINIKEVSHKIVAQLKQGIVNPDQQIQVKISGPSIYLPPRQATACSLILNELLQNALEHGLTDQNTGLISINLEDKGDEAIISVTDNGPGLPPDFQIDQTRRLGLQIVRTLVESDLKGHLQFHSGINDVAGLSVNITFPKTILGG